jgi:hypothetical protein
MVSLEEELATFERLERELLSKCKQAPNTTSLSVNYTSSLYPSSTFPTSIIAQKSGNSITSLPALNNSSSTNVSLTFQHLPLFPNIDVSGTLFC